MDKVSGLLSLSALVCCCLLGASTCPTMGTKIILGEGFNASVGIDLPGNGMFVCETNVAINSTIIRSWYYTAATNDYAGPVIISDVYTNSTELTYAYCKRLSTAVAAWTEDDHIVARSKPASLNQDNWLAITQVSGMDADQPDVSMNNLGNAFLVWRGTDAYGNRTVEFSQQASSGAAWSAPIILVIDSTIELPRVAANDAGDIFVIWLQDEQLWGMRKPASGPWEAPIQLSFGYEKPTSHRALVGRKGSDISYFSQGGPSYSRFYLISTEFTGWVPTVPVGTGDAINVNFVQSTGTGTIFGVKGLGPINANTAEESFRGWSHTQTLLNTNDQGGDPDVDASDLGRSWAIWGSIDAFSGTQVRLFDGTKYCPLVQIDDGLSSGPKVAMNELVYADPAKPTRPSAHFVWLARTEIAE